MHHGLTFVNLYSLYVALTSADHCGYNRKCPYTVYFTVTGFIRAGRGKIELVRQAIDYNVEIATIYMPMREELLHSVQSAKHEHSRGVWGHTPTGKF